MARSPGAGGCAILRLEGEARIDPSGASPESCRRILVQVGLVIACIDKRLRIAQTEDAFAYREMNFSSLSLVMEHVGQGKVSFDSSLER